jgi:hypothetical protein
MPLTSRIPLDCVPTPTYSLETPLIHNRGSLPSLIRPFLPTHVSLKSVYDTLHPHVPPRLHHPHAFSHVKRERSHLKWETYLWMMRRPLLHPVRFHFAYTSPWECVIHIPQPSLAISSKPHAFPLRLTLSLLES